MDIQKEIEKKELPLLIKQSSTYKIVIPAKVEEKIRYLLRKFPHTEWSGVLFTKHEGTFEDNNLVITCEDIFPMDLGNATFTQFCMNEEVASYMANNLDLFDCECQLIHSHHSMPAFFSGTDTNTLREEGNERNCFVSLIVNNAGTYCAAITRKIQTKHEVTIKQLGQSYEFFGEGEKQLTTNNIETTKVIDKEVIEYFMLDVERVVVNNPLAYLDTRFDEIINKKKEEAKNSTLIPKSTMDNPFIHNSINENTNFKEYLNTKSQVKEQILPFDSSDDASTWQPDRVIIRRDVSNIITCSLNSDNNNLSQWISENMYKKYDEIFINEDSFNDWGEYIIDYCMFNYSDPTIPEEYVEESDFLYSCIASAIYNELLFYKTVAEANNCGQFINKYLNILNRYML